MSGHSKWNNIKNKKAHEDALKGKVFGQVGRQIRVAVKEGKNGDPASNPSLRLALEKAKAVNMPKANIDRAIEKGLGKSKAGNLIEEVVYEGYGPNGVGMMIYAVTDNRNRTGAEIRGLLERAGGSLGGPGSASYLFEVEPSTQEVKTKIPLPSDDKTKEAVGELVDTLEENEDVELVVTNMV